MIGPGFLSSVGRDAGDKEMKIILINSKGNVIVAEKLLVERDIAITKLDITRIKACYADVVRVKLPDLGLDLAI